MSQKIITWGDAIKRKHQNICEDSISEKRNKVESKLIPTSMNDENEKSSEDDYDSYDTDQDSSWDSHAFSLSDLQGAGVGHSIVCQVLPSQNSIRF